MKYFLDTEFIEDGRTIDLISIGIVAEDGREFYAVSRECRVRMASGWVWENVLHPMGVYSIEDWTANPGDPSVSPRLRDTLLAQMSRPAIANAIIDFMVDPVSPPEIWADYGAHDFVAFGQLMSMSGRDTHNPMTDCYPRGFPWYYNEIRQLESFVGGDLSQVSRQDEHNAISDARWAKAAWEALQSEV